MTRKLLYITLPFLVSLFCSFYLDLKIYFILTSLILFISLVFIATKRIDFKRFFIMLISYMSAMTLFFSYSSEIMDIQSDYLTGEHIFYGKVTDITDYSSDKSTYVLTGKTDNKTKSKILMYTDSIDCNIDDYITVHTTFSEIENSYLFDSKDYYNAKGIYLQTDTITKIVIEKNISKWALFKNKVIKYRENISSKIIQKFKENNGGILIAMIFGDKKYLDTSVKTAFYRTGIGHVMAVSGLHLVFLVYIIDFILEIIGFSRKIRCLIAVIISFLFALSVGFLISIIRAAIMITLLKLSGVFYRQPDALNTLGICAFLMVLKSPYVIMDSSFLLSILGTFGLTVFSPFITEKIKSEKFFMKPIEKVISMTCVSLCIFPISVLFFDEISLLSPISNVVLIPICMVILFFGFAIFLTGANETVLEIIYPVQNKLINLIDYITSKTASVKYFYITVDKNSVMLLIFCIVFAVVMIYFLFKNPKITALSLAVSIMSLSICFCVNQVKQKDVLKIALLEKTGSKIIVVSYQNKSDIIDLTGGTKDSRYAYEYLENKKSDISSIVLLNKIGYSAASYTENFKYTNVSSVLVPKEYETLMNNRKICNSEPIYFENNTIEISSGEMTIKIYLWEDNQTRVDIAYNNTTISFNKSENTSDTNADINVFYEENNYCNVIYNNQSRKFSQYVEFEIKNKENVRIRNLI